MFSRSLKMPMLLTALLLSAVAIPSFLQAQQSTLGDLGVTAAQVAAPVSSAPASVADQTAAPGPRLESVGFAWPVETSQMDYGQPTVQSQGGGFGPNVALMGVGAAAVVVGLMIDGDGGTIVAITGGVIGLLGLYRFLQ